MSDIGTLMRQPICPLYTNITIVQHLINILLSWSNLRTILAIISTYRYHSKCNNENPLSLEGSKGFPFTHKRLIILHES